MQLYDIAIELTKKLKGKVNCYILHNELDVEVEKKQLRSLCHFLKKSPYNFEQLIDLSGVDYLHYKEEQLEQVNDNNIKKTRFAVAYHLLSLQNNIRIRIKCYCDENKDFTNVDCTYNPTIYSVSDIWHSANWYEREAFDLFGIIFEKHPKLEKILTDYDFQGYPLRKDFPQSGKQEVYYDEQEQQIQYRSTSIKEKI